MRYTCAVAGITVLCLASAVTAGKKKNPDDVTQTLALPMDPPAVAVGETRRLLFSVSPLSGKGLLTQQTRDALKAILKDNGGAPVVHIRAFVAGSGDVRRVPQIVSQIFTEKKLPLPSVSVIRAGGLPVENAQVVLEAVSIAKKEVNPGSVRFVASGEEVDKDPAASARPLLDKALDRLGSKAGGSGALEVTCFVSELNRATEMSAAITRRFPGAAVDLVQTQRLPWQAFASCEAVTRGAAGALPRLAFTGTRVAFGALEKDAALAFQRLDKDLAEAGAAPADIVLTNVYPLSAQAANVARQMRPPANATSGLIFEGLASIDAGFAVDAIAGVSR